MKQIEPNKNTNEDIMATQLKVTIIEDDLEIQAFFNWYLFTDTGEVVNNGITMCNNEDYTNWDGNSDFPYNFVASLLGLTIIGD